LNPGNLAGAPDRWRPFAAVYALRPLILDGDRQGSRPTEKVGLVIGRAHPFLKIHLHPK
jgi:hypothetical protein